MGKIAAIKTKNRSHNAGGVMPNTHQTAASLAVAFEKFTKSNMLSHDSHRALLLFLYLWLTDQLDNITSLKDIPDLLRVSTSDKCEAHCLRNFKDGNISWTEYAQPYHTQQGILYLWQPLPTALQVLFQPLVSSLSYQTPMLNQQEKKRFYSELQKRWKTPLLLRRCHRNKRDLFFRYFPYCIQVDAGLSSLAKMVLLGPERLHHRNATAYQAEETDRLRKKIFLAQNRYLERIIIAIKQLDISKHFTACILEQSKNLSEPTINIANYLKKNGIITVYQLNTQNGSKQYEAIPSMRIGSQRSLAEHDVVAFFNALHDKVEAHNFAKNMTLEQHRLYYNLRTIQLAFLFITLTGVRPTHAITIERRRCFAGEKVCVFDKGQWRPVILCSYLKTQISEYQQLQKALTMQFPHHQPNQAMWYLIDEQGEQQLLTARILRTKMYSLWPGVVPYQLRHFFAQCALTSLPPNHLATQQIDRLMGHSNLGEHLGSDDQFPLSLMPLHHYLEHLVKRLGLLTLRRQGVVVDE
ncbi:hypothetical protein E2R68_04980 [Psychromonas sp. RZ22]|uniref:hypothetical protein n=1 Tax=Psychromonas algarum TaxID=2555643 RepID=UPI00106881CD|nr:hypothetical protein [Psychromonas sp. RZ22]TEW55731.1 hypothetical protein E2R68_04980 [Psychromonas sp. RZ22]